MPHRQAPCFDPDVVAPVGCVAAVGPATLSMVVLDRRGHRPGPRVVAGQGRGCDLTGHDRGPVPC